MAIIEVARYKLREGTDEQALIQAEKEIQQGVARQYAGNLGRELSRGENGDFVLIMRWEFASCCGRLERRIVSRPGGAEVARVG